MIFCFNWFVISSVLGLPLKTVNKLLKKFVAFKFDNIIAKPRNV